MLPRGKPQIASIIGVAVFVLSSVASAASDVWDNIPGGNWENSANWTDGSTPGISDTATFNLPQSYLVTFGVDPAVIQSLSVTAGTVALRSSGGARTLNLTAGAGNQDIVVSGATTALTLGTASNPLHLNAGDDLAIRNGATLAVLFGSHVTAFDLSDSGLNGTLRVDGAGSMLTLGGTIANLVATSGAGSVVFQNSSTGNTINGSLGVADSATPSVTGSLSILSGASLSLGGNLTLANQNITGQVGNVTINGANSSFTQTGTSSITVGSAANGTATIAIGTTASGGTLTTGTGLFTINKTGTVTIGSGSNTGALNLTGDLNINGGVLQKSSAASVFDLAEGKTVTIQAGGRLTLAGPGTADSNQVFNVSGANSRLEITGTSALTIGGGAQVNLSAGAALTGGGRIDVGNGAANTGTLSVAGSSATATGGSELSTWASGGGTADVSFSDGAVGAFGAGLDLANAATAGTTAVVNVLTGAKLNTGNLNLATAGGTATSATLNVDGTIPAFCLPSTRRSPSATPARAPPRSASASPTTVARSPPAAGSSRSIRPVSSRSATATTAERSKCSATSSSTAACSRKAATRAPSLGRPARRSRFKTAAESNSPARTRPRLVRSTLSPAQARPLTLPEQCSFATERS